MLKLNIICDTETNTFINKPHLATLLGLIKPAQLPKGGDEAKEAHALVLGGLLRGLEVSLGQLVGLSAEGDGLLVVLQQAEHAGQPAVYLGEGGGLFKGATIHL